MIFPPKLGGSVLGFFVSCRYISPYIRNQWSWRADESFERGQLPPRRENEMGYDDDDDDGGGGVVVVVVVVVVVLLHNL